MELAEVHLEFLGQNLWWIAVGGTLGLALVAYALLGRKRGMVGEAGVSGGSGAGGGRNDAALRQGVLPGERRVFGRSLAGVSGVVGLAILAGTGLFAWLLGVGGKRNAGGGDALEMAGLVGFLGVSLLAAVYLFYRGNLLRGGRRMTLMLLRLAGMGALLLLLFRPVLAIVHGEGEAKPVLAVVVDASASMGYNDAANQPTRYRQAVIAIQNTLVPRLEKAYRMAIFPYDGKHSKALGSAEELDGIVPEGNVTDLGAALAAATGSPEVQGSGREGAGRLAGAVLFSDGIHNGAASVESELGTLGEGGGTVPVHTVRIGSSDLEPSSVPDIAVVSVDGPQTAVVNNEVVLTAAIRSTAMSDRTVRVILSEKGGEGGGTGTMGGAGKVLGEERLVLHSGALPQTVQLKLTPEKVGRLTVRVAVPVDPGERSDVNNQQDFSLLVTDPKLAVLYVEGRVRPEVGPLRRALEQDPNLAAVSLVQTVAGRFEMSGAKASDGLRGLPTTLAQWKKFKVIVLGDLDASFLSPEQVKDVEQVVREGAGLVMIGGQNSFAPGNWDKTELAKLLPVKLEKEAPAQINRPFVPELTAVGSAHPIFRNIASYFLAADGSKGAVTVPELKGCVALGGEVKGAKAGATVLAVHPGVKIDGEPAIVLAVQQYGKGRTAAFAADTTYLWSLFLRGMQKESPYNRFWGQMVRWLASEEELEKKTGASVTAMMGKERFDAGETVSLRAAVTDAQGQATNFAKVWADVTGPDGKTNRVPMAARGKAEEGQIGMYDAVEKPAMSGSYKVVFGASKEEKELGKDETSFLVMPAAGERDILAAQPHTLEVISRQTGGSAVDLSGLEGLCDRLVAGAPSSPAAAATVVPLYDSRGFFGVFIGCIAVEWFLRRRWQLQ